MNLHIILKLFTKFHNLDAKNIKTLSREAKLFLYDFIYLFLERGREGEREEEKHQCVVASHAPPTGVLAHNPGMWSDWELNWQHFGFQAGAQSTEPHKPGRETKLFDLK